MNGTRASESGLITARRFAFAVVEVEQFQILHLLKTGRKFGIEMIENVLRARNHFADIGKRFQRRAILRINGQIPRTQFCQFQLALAFVLDFADGGHDFRFDRVMKLLTIFRRVIEPAFQAENKIAIIFKARVLRDLRAQLDQFIQNFLALFRILQTAFGDQFPSFLPQRAVRFFEITAHLHECFFFAAKIHRLRADQFLILLARVSLLPFPARRFRVGTVRRDFSLRGQKLQSAVAAIFRAADARHKFFPAQTGAA